MARSLRDLWLWRLPLFLALAAVGGAGLSALVKAGADEWIYRYVGFAWASGDLPYRDAFENKPPGNFLVWRLIWTLADGNPIVGRVLGLAAACGAAALVGTAASRLWGSRRGWLGGCLFLVAICSPAVDRPYADTETFGILFTTGAAALALRSGAGTSRAALAGLLCGLALLFKPVFAIETAVIGVLLAGTPTSTHERARTLVGVGLGAVLPMVVAMLFFAAQGALSSFLEVVFGAMRMTVMRPANHLHNSVEAGTAGLSAMAVALAALAAGGASARRAARDPRAVYVIAGWAVLALAIVGVQGAYYGHQFKPALVPLALLSPGLLVALDQYEGPREPLQPIYRFLAVLLVLVLGGSAANSLQVPAEALVRRLAPHSAVPPTLPRTDASTVAEVQPPADTYPSPEAAVRALTQPGDRIWCFPRSEVYTATRRRSAVRHFTPHFIWYPRPREEILTGLRTGRARMVLIHWPTLAEWQQDPFLDGIRATVERRFEKVGQSRGWSLYLWKGGER